MTSFRWDCALTELSQRLPDLREQSDILPLRAQRVRGVCFVRVQQYTCNVLMLCADGGVNGWWV